MSSDQAPARRQNDNEPVSAETQARARAAVCMLNAAIALVGSVAIEGPRGEQYELAEDTVPINHAISDLMRKLMNIEDGKLR